MFLNHTPNERPFSRIDLSPLIGLLCVLLALFALSSHNTMSSTATPTMWEQLEPAFNPVPVELVIESPESFYWAGTQVDRRQLLAQLDSMVSMPQPPSLLIQPQKSTPYAQLVDLLGELDKRSLHNRAFVEAKN